LPVLTISSSRSTLSKRSAPPPKATPHTTTTTTPMRASNTNTTTTTTTIPPLCRLTLPLLRRPRRTRQAATAHPRKFTRPRSSARTKQQFLPGKVT
jgi:hypothetical protein